MVFILLVQAVAFASEPDTQQSAAALTVMSFNIRYGTASDGDNHWTRRRQLVFDVLRKHDPDIVGLQEALDFQLDELLEALPHYAYVGVGRDDGERAGEFAAILYRRERYRVDDSGTFWLSDTPEVAGSKSWGNQITRICTWARLVPLDGGPPFYVFNAHLDHQSQPSRERGVELIARRIAARKHDDPAIVTGDFNCGEDNVALQPLFEDKSTGGLGLIDTFRAVHPDAKDVGTFNSFRGERGGAKIDYIFAPRNVQVLDGRIVHDRPGNRDPSDHFPVLARLVLGRASTSSP